jgi:hypothetical protein
MAKHRKKSHSRGKTTLPIAIVAPVAVVAFKVGKDLMAGNTLDVQQSLTGVGPDGQFHSQFVIPTYMPIAAGAAIHYAASRFGVNKMLGRARIPLIRV